MKAKEAGSTSSATCQMCTVARYMAPSSSAFPPVQPIKDQGNPAGIVTRREPCPRSNPEEAPTSISDMDRSC